MSSLPLESSLWNGSIINDSTNNAALDEAYGSFERFDQQNLNIQMYS